MTSPLAPRDVNTFAPQATAASNPFDPAAAKPALSEAIGSAGEMGKSLEYHRQLLASRIAEDKQQQTYISPSDTIMSPCTAKLAAMKTKHFIKSKPQSLFAKAASRNAVAATAEGEDIAAN